METQTGYPGKDLEAMSFAQRYHRWIIAEIAPYLGQQAAEIGAGTGEVSKLLLDNGVESLSAFEPSDNLYPLLAANLEPYQSARTVHGFFEDHSEQLANTLDSVAFINVLEHIEHDADALQHAHRILKPGGHLLIFVPALQMLYSPHDAAIGHFRRYRRGPLVSMIESCGFEIERARYFDILGILPWLIAFRILKQDLGSGQVSLYDKLVVPVARVLEKLITPPIGKNVLVIARKPDALSTG